MLPPRFSYLNKNTACVENHSNVQQTPECSIKVQARSSRGLSYSSIRILHPSTEIVAWMTTASVHERHGYGHGYRHELISLKLRHLEPFQCVSHPNSTSNSRDSDKSIIPFPPKRRNGMTDYTIKKITTVAYLLPPAHNIPVHRMLPPLSELST
jgi:hypothetical protein